MFAGNPAARELRGDPWCAPPWISAQIKEKKRENLIQAISMTQRCPRNWCRRKNGFGSEMTEWVSGIDARNGSRPHAGIMRACFLVHEARSEENLNLFVDTRFVVDLEFFAFLVASLFLSLFRLEGWEFFRLFFWGINGFCWLQAETLGSPENPQVAKTRKSVGGRWTEVWNQGKSPSYKEKLISRNDGEDAANADSTGGCGLRSLNFIRCYIYPGPRRQLFASRLNHKVGTFCQVDIFANQMCARWSRLEWIQMCKGGKPVEMLTINPDIP